MTAGLSAHARPHICENSTFFFGAQAEWPDLSHDWPRRLPSNPV